MYKRILTIGLVFITVFSLVGCGNNGSGYDETQNQSGEELASGGDYYGVGGAGYAGESEIDYSKYYDMGEAPEDRRVQAGPWITYVNPEQGETDSENGEGNHEDNTTVKGKVYSKIVVTGIREEYDSVGYSIAGFMDGSAFQITGMDANGEMTYGDYSPGKPDSLELRFDTETGEAISVIYYGTYNDPEGAEMGVETLNEHLYLFGDDITSVKASGTKIEVSFDPSSAHIEQALRTYFLDGRHDPEGYTEYCKGIYENGDSRYSDYKGDNYACDVMRGIKVTWYE